MIDILKIPSEQDWGDYASDLDSEYVYKMFFGKNFEQVFPRFEYCIIEAVDEIRFMPLIPFRYYIQALANYMTSKAVLANNSWSSDAASCFLGLVLEKLSEAPSFIVPILKDLMPAVEFVATNQELFDANIDIYGDFLDQLSKIKQYQ